MCFPASSIANVKDSFVASAKAAAAAISFSFATAAATTSLSSRYSFSDWSTFSSSVLIAKSRFAAVISKVSVETCC